MNTPLVVMFFDIKEKNQFFYIKGKTKRRKENRKTACKGMSWKKIFPKMAIVRRSEIECWQSC